MKMRRFLAAATVGILCALAGQAGPARAHGGHSINQHWTVITQPGQPTRVNARGALDASGTVIDVLALLPNGTFDNFATQVFPDGNLFYHGQGTYEIHVNPDTCRGTGDVVGPFVITGGTGAYAGATGEGVALIHLRFSFDRTATGCAPFPSKVYGVARANGTLNLP
jgi:hypothetical protein